MGDKQVKAQGATRSRAAAKPSVHVVAIVCCEYVITDQSEKNSLIGIFDNLRIRVSDPSKAVSRPFFLYVALEDVGRAEIKIQLLAPSGESIIEGVMSGDPETAPPETGRVTSIVKLQFPAREAGQYRFVLLADGQVIGSTTLVVTHEEGQHGSSPS